MVILTVMKIGLLVFEKSTNLMTVPRSGGNIAVSLQA